MDSRSLYVGNTTEMRLPRHDMRMRLSAECAPAIVRLQRETIIALGAIMACLALDLIVLPMGIDVVDEGYFVQQATRVLHGEVPYRDFDSMYTPGLLYLHAGG